MKMNRVLIIDDEILTIQYLKSLHSWEEFDCGDILYAVTGAGALDIFKKEKPQIVFVDVRMPGMDGLELSRKFLSENPGVSIVIMTAYQEFDYVKEAMELGIQYFLVKHEITEETLSEVLKKISDGFLSKKRYEQMMENDWLLMHFTGELRERCHTDSGLTPVLFLSSAYESYESLKGMCSIMKRYCDCVLAQRESVVWEDMFLTYERLLPEKLEPMGNPKDWTGGDISLMLAGIRGRGLYMEEKDLTHIRQYICTEAFLSFLKSEEKEVPIVSLEQLFRACLRYYKDPEPKKRAEKSAVRQAVAYIHNHYAEDISSTVIAEKLKVSDGYLRLLFKRGMDCTVRDYILNYRMEKAKILLLDNKKKIYEIAEECGFLSSQHFSRVFRQMTGIAPGEFRQRHKGANIDEEIYRF